MLPAKQSMIKLYMKIVAAKNMINFDIARKVCMSESNKFC